MIDIIYEDKYLIIVNKPPKLLTIANNKESKKTLYHQVREYLSKKNERVFIIHRLDYETSGLIMFAKLEQVKEKMQNSWDRVERGYIAKVSGIVKKDEDTLINYLRETKTLRTYVAETGKLAITEYSVIKREKNSSLLNINLKTGRKNQIRVQLANIGNPIIGDLKYGYEKNRYMLLHANSLSFIHPINNERIEFKINIPTYF